MAKTTQKLSIFSKAAPWTDAFSHEFSVWAALKIARDIHQHRRWGVDQQPCYDVSAEGVQYVGDKEDPAIQRKADLYVCVYEPRAYQMTTDQLADVIYRGAFMHGAVERYRGLLGELAAMVAGGVLVEDPDETITQAASRLTRDGYTVEALRREVGIETRKDRP